MRLGQIPDCSGSAAFHFETEILFRRFGPPRVLNGQFRPCAITPCSIEGSKRGTPCGTNPRRNFFSKITAIAALLIGAPKLLAQQAPAAGATTPGSASMTGETRLAAQAVTTR